MPEEVVENLDTRMSLWVVVAIGLSKQIEYTVTDIIARFVTFSIGGIDLTAWGLYGILWMGSLALILTFKTLE